MGPEGGRLDRPTQAVRQTCSGNLGIVKILCYIRSDMCTASATNSKLLYIARKIGPPLAIGALCLSTMVNPALILVYFYKRNFLISILNLLTLALLTVNLPMSNRFAHKEGIWYDYLCPHVHKKEEMTRTTSLQEIFKGE